MYYHPKQGFNIQNSITHTFCVCYLMTLLCFSYNS